MATGSRNSSSEWVNPYTQEETPAELKKRKKKEAKEKQEKKREAKEREREAKERERDARRKEAKEKDLKTQIHDEGNSSDKHSQGQPDILDTTDPFGILDIPFNLDTRWAEFTGEGRKPSHKMESVSVKPNKVHVITLVASLIW